MLRLDVDAVSQNLKVNGFYAENMLSGVKTVDEDGAVSIVYTDKEGHTVYEERQLRGEGDVVDRIVTRYVYDDCGRLAWVVTPEGVDRLTQGASYAATSDLARNYCYFYRYDEYGRQIERQMPGREPEYMVYDRRDRLMMSQDGNMRTKKQWMIYRYDYLNRLTLQSLTTDTSTDQALRHKEFCDAFNSLNPPALYTGPSTTVQKYAYDHYGWFNDPALAFEHVDGLTRENGASLQDPEVRGYKTYEQLAVLTADDIQDYHDRAFYYDYKGRVIQTVEKDSRGNILRTTSRYDLIGNLLAQRESYTHGGTTDVLDRTFEYDSRNRLLKETAQFNDGEQAVVAYSYDAVGQLTGKTYGTGAHAIHETMEYNIQGWLTEKNSELFDMNLNYFQAPREWFEPSYTGNIVSWQWSHKQINGNAYGDDCEYGFHYDDLSRLTAAELFINDSIDANNEYTENDITYDKNSNILTLNRTSSSEEDDREFEFSYIGNLRDQELGEGRSYQYDANGNMTQDGTNYFVISYNFLNLPTYMDTYADYSNYYGYLADGTKVQHDAWDGRNHAYRGSLVYNNGQFESASFGSGRIVGTDNGSEVHYFLTDHLGSTRVVAKVTPTGREDLDRKDYYPFGKEWRQPDMPASDNRYMFSGKERSDICLENDYSSILPIYDFGARSYYPEGVFFLQQDPLMERNYSCSAYIYCLGNPVLFFDPNGKREWPVNKTFNGAVRRHENNFGAPRSNGRTHQGVDINMGSGSDDLGAPVYATHDGTVTRIATIDSGDKNAGGNRVQITYSDESGTVSTSYMHLNTISEDLKEGEPIAEGTQIGTVGQSGFGKEDGYKAPHLHYEIRINGETINPATGRSNLVDPQLSIAPKDGGTIPTVVVNGAGTSRNIMPNQPIAPVVYDPNVIK